MVRSWKYHTYSHARVFVSSLEGEVRDPGESSWCLVFGVLDATVDAQGAVRGFVRFRLLFAYAGLAITPVAHWNFQFGTAVGFDVVSRCPEARATSRAFR